MFNNIPHTIRLLTCAMAIVALAACNDDDDPRYATPPGTETPPDNSSPGGAPLLLEETAAGTVFAAQGSVQVLVPESADSDTFVVEERDAAGFSLYTFDKDPIGDSSCAGDCLKSWPPLMAGESDEAEEPFSIVDRGDGLGRQWALRGKPLYLFNNDAAAGDINGDGVGNAWHLATSQPVLLSKSDVPREEGEFLVASGEILTYVPETEGDFSTFVPVRKSMERFTLYTFANDEPGASNCGPPDTGACLNNWPPLMADADDVAAPPFSIIERVIDEDGNTAAQWAYHDKPLYFFSKDTAAGETAGKDVDNWHLARPMPFLAADNSLGSLIAGAGKVRALSPEDEAEVVDVARQGYTLYTFDNDEPGLSSCEGECAEKWPPLIAHEGAQAAAPFTLVERSPGVHQWAINGWPLYFFNNDAAAGEANGEGAAEGKWHVARVAPVMASDNPEEGLLFAAHGLWDENGNPVHEGHTLYTFNNDPEGASTCKDGCAENWPPLYAPEDAVGFGEFTVIDRTAELPETPEPPEEDPVQEILEEGQSQFNSQCSGCHGAKGDVGTIIDVSKFDEETLFAKIQDTMPKGNAGACVDECALVTTAYILNGYSTEVDEATTAAFDSVTAASNPILEMARQEYVDKGCQNCHGAEGDGDTPIDLSKYNPATLFVKIEASMPKPNPAACVGDCAVLITSYILNGYSTEVPGKEPQPEPGTGYEESDKQWAYKGKPLYFYSEDTQAGDTAGKDVENWEIARP